MFYSTIHSHVHSVIRPHAKCSYSKKYESKNSIASYKARERKRRRERKRERERERERERLNTQRPHEPYSVTEARRSRGSEAEGVTTYGRRVNTASSS